MTSLLDACTSGSSGGTRGARSSTPIITITFEAQANTLSIAEDVSTGDSAGTLAASTDDPDSVSFSSAGTTGFVQQRRNDRFVLEDATVSLFIPRRTSRLSLRYSVRFLQFGSTPLRIIALPDSRSRWDALRSLLSTETYHCTMKPVCLFFLRNPDNVSSLILVRLHGPHNKVRLSMAFDPPSARGRM